MSNSTLATSTSTSRKDSNSSGELQAKEEETRMRSDSDEPISDLGGKYRVCEFGAISTAKLAACF